MRTDRVWVAGLWALVLLAITSVAHASDYVGDEVCARVVIEIEQELTLERQGFEARMRITNSVEDRALEDVHIEVLFEDEDGSPVHATSDPDASDATFFVREDQRDGIQSVNGGRIDPASVADIRWLIVPAPGAADGVPSGKLYFVGAHLEYTVGGEREVVDVAPDRIFVKPMPRLTLDYFLPRDVHANDPFTDEVEPAEPFTLGVRVRNNGEATARSVSIDSAQPRIVENEQGLAIGFEILGSQVNAEPVAPTLLLELGDVPSGGAATGRWEMVTTLSGEFVDFEAEFSHDDELGGSLTSLVEAANTHTLIHDVLVDLPGRDDVKDFLADDGDAIRVYESSGDTWPVADHSGAAELSFQQRNGDRYYYELTAPAEPGFQYVRLGDPSHGERVITEVTRSDGKHILEPNGWSSRTRADDRTSWDYHVNLFDADTTGTYTVVMAAERDVPQAPTIAHIPDRVTYEGGQVSFLVEASDPNGGPVSLAAEGLPPRASFVDQGDGNGVFMWRPLEGQAGQYQVTFVAQNATMESSRGVGITVNPWWDPDGEGNERPGDGDDDDGSDDDASDDDVASHLPAESGFAQAAPTWSSVQLHNAFEQPVLLLGVPSGQALESGVAQARALDADGFDLRFRELDADTHGSGHETVPYLVLEAGRYRLPGETTWEAGVVAIPADGEWSDVAFTKGFDGAPEVFLTLQGASDETAIIVSSREVGTEGFEIAALPADPGHTDDDDDDAGNPGAGDSPVTRQQVAYLAVHSGEGQGAVVFNDVARGYQLDELPLDEDLTAFAGTHLRLEPLGGDGPVAAAAAVMALDGGVYAQPGGADAPAAVSVRRGTADTPPPATLAFSQPAYHVQRSVDHALVTLVREGDLSDAVTVAYSTSDRSAVAGEDYVATQGTVTFGIGQATRVVEIPLLPGAADAGPVELRVRIDDVQGNASVGGAAGSVTVYIHPVSGGDGGDDGDDGSGDDGAGDGDGGDSGGGHDADEPAAGLPGESGHAQVGNDWTTVPLHQDVEQPVLLLGRPLAEELGAGVVHARHLTETGFELRFSSWDDDAGTSQGSVPYLVLEAGRYHLLDGSTWKVGVVETIADRQWSDIAFDGEFDQAPELFLSLVTANHATAPAPRAREVHPHGFQIAAAPREMSSLDAVVAEQVAYVAVHQPGGGGSLTLDGVSRSYDLAHRSLFGDEGVSVLGTELYLHPMTPQHPVPSEMASVLVLDGAAYAQTVTDQAPVASAIRRGSPGGDDDDTGTDPGDGDPGDGSGDDDTGDRPGPGDGDDGDTGPDDGDGDGSGDGSGGDQDPGAPRVTAPADITVDAAGDRTAVELGEAEVVTDSGASLTATPDPQGPFEPGRHVVTWTATDGEGRTGTAEQIVSVRPQAAFGPAQWVSRGSAVEVTVHVNGDAPAYPVEIPFTVGGNAPAPQMHTATDGVIRIDEGEHRGTYRFDVRPGGEPLGTPELDVTFAMEAPENAAVGPQAEHTVWIVTRNLPPTVGLTASQFTDEDGAPVPTRTVLRDGGPVTVTAHVNDPNTGDMHIYDWSHSPNALVDQPDGDPATFVFDPAELDPRPYMVHVRATDSGSPPRSSRSRMLLRVISACPYDNGDEACIHVGDSNGDGIPDYVADERTSRPHGIPVAPGRELVTTPGLRLVLGRIAVAAERAFASVTLADIEAFAGTTGEAAAFRSSSLEGYENVGGYVDFQVHGLAAAREQAQVVVPLPEGTTVPPRASYRKFVAGTGWSEFVVDGHNAIHSAVRDAAGECPLPGDARYAEGLKPGTDCVQLTIEDGGPNDTSAGANGVVADPGGVFAPLGDDEPAPGDGHRDGEGGEGGGSGGGCSGGLLSGKPDPTFPLAVAGGLLGLAVRARCNRPR